MNNKTNNPLHYFSAKANGNTLVLDVMDVIGGDMFSQGITALAIKTALDESGEYSDIQLNINSPGGDAYEGVTAFNVLRASGKPVAVNVMGMAASAASIVAMAGDTITMMPGSTLMIHNAMSICAGFADDMRKMADTLDTVSESIADIYVSRTKNSKKSVMEMMSQETWMDAKEAVANGFATSVGKHQAVKNSFDLSTFKNVPEELKIVAEVPAEVVELVAKIEELAQPLSEAFDPTEIHRMQFEINKRK